MEKQNEANGTAKPKCCEKCLEKYGACRNVPWCPLLGKQEVDG